MNGDTPTIDGIIGFLNEGVKDDKVEVVVAPPAPYLAYVKSKLSPNVFVAAQNSYKEAKGAFTGEISPAMLKDLGLKYVILGHSERRHVFGETDDLIAAKTVHALENGLVVVFCIGEKLEEREAGHTKEVSTTTFQYFYLDKNFYFIFVFRSTSVNSKPSLTRKLTGPTLLLPTNPFGLLEPERPLLPNKPKKSMDGSVNSSRRRSQLRSPPTPVLSMEVP